MDPATIAALISAAGAAAGGFLGRNKGDKRKNALIDDLLASLKGKGSYNDLFSGDQAAFQKSVVDPAKNLFNNQIAPQIQQQYIQSGQQRGTGLDDTLTRAGVNLDDLINQHYLQFQESGKNRASSIINSILGGGNPAGQSAGSAAGQGLAGYFGSKGFGQDANAIAGNDDISKILAAFNNKNSGEYGVQGQDFYDRAGIPRKGFRS